MSAASTGKRKRHELDQPRRVIQLLATNDCHSQMEPASDGLGGIARRATYLRQARERHGDAATLLLDIGDVFLGSLHVLPWRG
jgi:2',3'-cyclic-nucleotide 2'-phosphodiesterase (5'-nucleotidase family)